MKKILLLVSAIILSLSLVACSSASGSEKGEDNAFIKDVKKSFEARSKYIDSVESQKEPVEVNVYYKEAVLKEKSILEKYKEAKFDNPELGKVAQDYLEGLNKQEDSLKYFTSDLVKFDEKWQEGYNLRSTALTTLVDKFGLKLNEKDFEDLKNNAQVVKENDAIKSKVDTMVKDIKFEQIKDEYGWKDYEATVANTAGVDFESFYLDVKLLDKEGVVVESVPVSPNGAWKKDQKIKLNFSTEKDFQKLEWTSEYYIAE